MNILIVDDEALARSRLRTLLADSGCGCANQRHHVAEAATAAEALAWLSPTGGRACDLVLLDIHMPGQNGLALAHSLRALSYPPAIVFVTAHTDHALSAFELDAVDYLTKPVRRERLQQALAKAQRAAPANLGLTPAATQAPGEALLIQDRGRTERVPLAEVLYFKAELKYITVRTAQATYILDGSLTEIEQDYGAGFMRVHRNALVAKRAITTLEKHHDEEYGEGWAVRLQGIAEPIAISRRQLVNVRSAIQKL